MEYERILGGAISTLKALGASPITKTIYSAILAMVLHKHAMLFYGFVALVFLDCFTRWMSISFKNIVDNQAEGEADPGVWQTFLGIKAARSKGLISSDAMKHRFLGKILVYLLCVISASIADVIMYYLSTPTWAVALVISYLVVTELLSIVENLNEAGIEAVQGLIDILKRKRGGTK